MSKNINDTELLEHLVESKINFIKEINKTVIGQKDILDQMLIALLKRSYFVSWSSRFSKNIINQINGRNL